jgi:citrate synthase
LLAQRLKAPEGYADIIRRLLVLGADHELDPSTYAVRAVANSGVSVYQAAVAGLASAVGRRLSFGRTQALSQMFREIFEGPGPEEAVLRRLREGEQVHGFGSRMYPDGDPRAAALLEWLQEAVPDDPYLRRLNQAIAVAQDAMDRKPDFVIPLTFVGHRLGLIGREGILLRVARMGGWIAHAMEQFHSQELVRPRTVYRGELPEFA